jgi:hydrogenase 3 maturation protease
MVLLTNVLLGIGNPLLGDDGAGPFIASQIRGPGWEAFDCGTVPENFTGKVKELHPDVLVLVDAADMNLEPGEFREVAPDYISDVAFGTHSLPLGILIDYLAPYAGQVIFIGIQPGLVAPGAPLSPAVRRGARRLAGLIEAEEFDVIDDFIPGGGGD